ncbi:hypothetical protein DFH08DRAFT_804578 [Mycena albidolilacea]|uniref:AAA-ATPase-like domain-containing protein n=1 Tax=Mycena albidolilacea TaxID=1033008 RepID=A0AAD7ACF7_9AGAR|nr:hypothetical protein DFH08DRAFT_804578 [Mycena albidolilacea]
MNWPETVTFFDKLPEPHVAKKPRVTSGEVLDPSNKKAKIDYSQGGPVRVLYTLSLQPSTPSTGSTGSKRSIWSDDEDSSDSEHDRKRVKMHPLAHFMPHSNSFRAIDAFIHLPRNLYVDKTKSIMDLPDKFQHLVLRPPQFGKTMFLSTLYHFYNIHGVQHFAERFGSLAVVTEASTPIPHSQHLCLSFNLSNLPVCSDRAEIGSELTDQIGLVLDYFLMNDYCNPQWYHGEIPVPFAREWHVGSPSTHHSSISARVMGDGWPNFAAAIVLADRVGALVLTNGVGSRHGRGRAIFRGNGMLRRRGGAEWGTILSRVSDGKHVKWGGTYIRQQAAMLEDDVLLDQQGTTKILRTRVRRPQDTLCRLGIHVCPPPQVTVALPRVTGPLTKGYRLESRNAWTRLVYQQEDHERFAIVVTLAPSSQSVTVLRGAMRRSTKASQWWTQWGAPLKQDG